MAQFAKQQSDQHDTFLKAMGTLFLFAGVILLDQLTERWFPTLKYINAFSTLLVFSVWLIFLYFCFKFYRASKFVEATDIHFSKKKAK